MPRLAKVVNNVSLLAILIKSKQRTETTGFRTGSMRLAWENPSEYGQLLSLNLIK